jgi:hypothetical protein
VRVVVAGNAWDDGHFALKVHDGGRWLGHDGRYLSGGFGCHGLGGGLWLAG